MQSRARDFRAGARASLKGNWTTAILVSLIVFALSLVIQIYNFTQQYRITNHYASVQEIYSGSIILSVLSLVVALALAPIVLGICRYFSRLNLGERPEFMSVFDRFSIAGKSIGLMLYAWLFIWLWSLLLIVPGIIASLRYQMAYYLMAEHPEMGIREAINRSKELMDGNKWRLFCLNLSFFGWMILASIPAGLGYIWLMPYIYATEAAFYLEITGRPYGLNENQSEQQI